MQMFHQKYKKKNHKQTSFTSSISETFLTLRESKGKYYDTNFKKSLKYDICLGKMFRISLKNLYALHHHNIYNFSYLISMKDVLVILNVHSRYFNFITSFAFRTICKVEKQFLNVLSCIVYLF